MKSAEEWAEELGVYGNSQLDAAHTIEAIREEMRRECLEAVKSELSNDEADLEVAILNAGKPKLRRGQLMFNSAHGQLWFVDDENQNDGDAGDLPLKWSDLCDVSGDPASTLSGPVFLKEAMEDE